MKKHERAQIHLRWRTGHLDSGAAIRDHWGKSAPAWYWLDPLPVLPLPGPQTPAAWGAGMPEFHGHEPRELRLFWERSAVHLVREAAGRYRWVELADSVEPASIRKGWWTRAFAWLRRPAETSASPALESDDWQTVAVSRRRQPVLLRPALLSKEMSASGHFEIVQYMADNRVLFWRLGWSTEAQALGGPVGRRPGRIQQATSGG